LRAVESNHSLRLMRPSWNHLQSSPQHGWRSGYRTQPLQPSAALVGL